MALARISPRIELLTVFLTILRFVAMNSDCCYRSSLVGNGAIILGDFQHLMIGMFGGTDLFVDPYSSASSAIVKITTHTFTGIAVRQPEAFCKIDLS